MGVPGRRARRARRVRRAHRDHGGLVFVDLRDRAGTVQVVIDPSDHAEAHAAAAAVRVESVVQVEGEIVRRAPETVNPKMATGEVEPALRRVPRALAGRAAALQPRRQERRRGAAHPPPLARPAPRRDAAPADDARDGHADHAPPPRGPRLPRPRDARPHEVDPGGRARLPRAGPPPARRVLRAAAVAAALQAALHDERLRALLPDRPLLPGRGAARRPAARVHAARHRDGVRRAGRDPRARRGALLRDLAGGARHRAAAPVPAALVARGDGALRLGQARHALRPGDRRRHGFVRTPASPSSRGAAAAGGVVRALARPGAAALSRKTSTSSPRSRRSGRQGPRLPAARPGSRGRRALADREVPDAGGARRARSAHGRAAGRRDLPRGRPRADRRARARRAPHAPRRPLRPRRPGRLRVRLRRRLPALPVGRGRRALGRRAPHVHGAEARARGAARHGSGRRHLGRLRLRLQRARDRLGLDQEPPPGRAAEDLRRRRLRRGGRGGALRLLAARAAARRAAARRHRARPRPLRDAARGHGEHPRRDRLPEDRRRARPAHGRADAGRRAAARRPRPAPAPPPKGGRA